MRCAPNTPLKERLMAKIRVDPETGCWLWTGAQNGRGYGYIGFKGGLHLTHRLMFELARGCSIPPKYETDHLCRSRACANPAHLECVTASENNRRGARSLRHRTHCGRGHEFTPGNRKVRANRGTFECRACANLLWNERARPSST